MVEERDLPPVLARRVPSWQVSFLDRALQGGDNRVAWVNLLTRGAWRAAGITGKAGTVHDPNARSSDDRYFAAQIGDACPCHPGRQVSCLDPCPTRSARDARHRGRSRSSTVPYRGCQPGGMGQLVDPWSLASRRHHGQAGTVHDPNARSSDDRYCRCANRRRLPMATQDGRSRASTVPYEVLSATRAIAAGLVPRPALRGPRATRAIVAGLVPRPCPTNSGGSRKPVCSGSLAAASVRPGPRLRRWGWYWVQSGIPLPSWS